MITIGSLFSGYGGLDLAVERVTGGQTVWVSDIDPGACRILQHHRPTVPNIGDISTVDWSTVQPVRVITGGFPCQDVSMAGRRAGMTSGTRSGLWSMMAQAVDQLRPELVVIENVRGLLSADGHADLEHCPWCMGDPDSEPVLRALGAVLGELADIGYDSAWHGLTAASVGAPHGRFRVFVIAWPARDTSSVVGQRRGPVRIERSRDAGTGGSADRPATQDTASAAGGERRQSAPGQTQSGRARADVGRPNGAPAADTTRDGRDEGRVESVAIAGGRYQTEPANLIQWGQFGPAVRRWESVLGRSAPAPTEVSRSGGQRLSPRFVEWMMGLDDGHVTGVPGLTRNEQLKALGNGVVPQQAESALRLLLAAVNG